MRDGARCVLEGFRNGSPDAFETLFRIYQRQVYGWLLRIVRNRTAAEDLTIETFWRMHTAHSRFDPARSFEGWARTIATHAALEWMRSHHEDAELKVDVAARDEADPAITGETRRAVVAALAHLSPKLRIAALLAVVEERPHKEVAEALGISVAAVKVRVFRAMHLLRRELERGGIRP